MECNDETNMYVNETLIDEWGGEVQLIDVSSDLQSMIVNIKTPWGDTENSEMLYKGITKTYTSGDKTYTVEMTLAGYVSGNYIGQIVVCYEFVEKVDTTLLMTYDSGASNPVEGEKLFFDILLKDQSGNILKNYDVDIYKNGVYEWQVPGDWRYEHIITADEVGQELIFQAKFDETLGFNASQSSTVSVLIPGKVETNLSINVDKATVSLGETISFTGTLKDESNNAVPNQTLYLVYKIISNEYAFVLNSAGDKLISSTDSSGNYYRPWEPTEEYLDYDTYAMYFEGTSNYETTYSPDITFDVTLNECEQNIKIQNQDYIPVQGVTVTIDDVSKITDADGLVSFVLVIDTQYVVYKVYGDYSGEDTITSCALNPQILHVVTPIEPTCIDYTIQTECEANGCYWWTSNNTCQSAPEGTTEYFDVYVKPYSWYEGNYEEAVSKALTLVTDLTGAMANYISSVTGYEYTGLEIKEDVNKNVIIVRIFLKDTSETSLVAPVIIAGAVGIIAGILIYTIGYVTGTSDGGYTKEEVIEIIDDASDAAVEACKERYPNRFVDITEAKAYADCVGGVDTTKVIADADIVDEDPTEGINTVDDGINTTKDGLDDGLINTENIDDVVDENIREPIDKIVDDYEEIAESDNCVYDIAGECIVTTGALQAAILVGAGILGLIAYSTMKK